MTLGGAAAAQLQFIVWCKSQRKTQGPQKMRKHTAVTILALCLGAGSALADELLWARKSTFGGLSTISIAQNGVLYCTGCNFNDYGRIAIQRGPGVGANVTGELHPWMSTLWVVLFRVDRGNHCEGDFFTISLNTHNLEHVNSSQFGCNSVNISVTEKGLGMVMTFTDGHGHREVHEVP